ncbi:hypothetical protein HMPREF3213_03169 [Heyndrickxia coagulans]|uniref:Uncharacterized protein n=1 Tax=Heyndrickxia coagulans TaxID=1398 RepID=A0A133KEI1_HEYCO|nr:hypothetical protein HMPREF3213_03169 [Heyndrickxia coagulans]
MFFPVGTEHGIQAVGRAAAVFYRSILQIVDEMYDITNASTGIFMGFTAHSFFNSFNGLVSVHYRILSRCFFCYECPRVFAKIGKQLA